MFMTDYRSEFPELGFYGLPGHTRSPRDVLKQVQDAETLGIGNVMLSERADYKEISAICGACAAPDGRRICVDGPFISIPEVAPAA